MGQQPSKAKPNGGETIDGIKWVQLQKTGKPSHQRYPAGDRATVLQQLEMAYQKELRVEDEEDPFGLTQESSLPQVHFYQGNETEQRQLYVATHGFYEACQRAWAYHASLVLSPDDVWLAIQAVFAGYMRLNAEALRTIFVAYEGQKELCISMDDAPSDWHLFVARVVKQVTANSKVDMDTTFVPAFTSSDALDTAMKHVAVMDHCQQYFSYTFSTCCGVQRVGLKGELADWELLRTYIKGLRVFAVPADKKDAFFVTPTRTYASWLDDLDEIAKQLIATHRGTPNVDWWNKMITKRETHGSGAATYIKGWIIALVSGEPIDQEMKPSSIKSLRFSVPITRDNNGRITKLRLLGGFTGVLYDSKLDSWTPQRSMAVLDDTLSPKNE